MSTREATEPCEQFQEALIETTLEAFRLHRTFRQALNRLESKDSQRFIGRADYFLSRIERNLEDAGMSLKTLQEGERYDPGMAVTALNIDDFDPDTEQLVIDQILEPIILNRHGVQRTGTVMLREGS